MKVSSSNRIKDVKANMRTISKLLKQYEEMEVVQMKARSAGVYDAAGENMQTSYKLIMLEMKRMLMTLDILGCACDALPIRDYNVIEQKSLFI